MVMVGFYQLAQLVTDHMQLVEFLSLLPITPLIYEAIVLQGMRILFMQILIMFITSTKIISLILVFKQGIKILGA